MTEFIGLPHPWYGYYANHTRPVPPIVISPHKHKALLFYQVDSIANPESFIFVFPKLHKHYAEADETALRFFMFKPYLVDPSNNFQGCLLHKDCYLIMQRDIYEPYEDYREGHKTIDDMHGKWKVRMLDLTDNADVTQISRPGNIVITGAIEQLKDSFVPFFSVFADWLLNIQDYHDNDIRTHIQFIPVRNFGANRMVSFPYQDLFPHEGQKYDYYIRQNAIRWLGFHVYPINLV